MKSVTPFRKESVGQTPINDSSMGSDIFLTMPKGYREKADWCKEKFGAIIASHIQYLKAFKILPDKDESLSFNGVFDEGYTRVQYGKLLIEFPYMIDKLRQNDWIKSFDIFVDHYPNPVILDPSIKSVPDIQNTATTSADRLVNKLLPKPINNMRRVPTPNRIIRIQIKK